MAISQLSCRTPETYSLAALHTLLSADPDGKGFAALLAADNLGGILAVFNTPANSVHPPRRVVSRDRLVGDVAPLLTTLKTFMAGSDAGMAAKAAAYKSVYDDLLKPKDTINMQSATVQTLFVNLVNDGFLTEDEANAYFVEDQGAYAEWLWGVGTVVTLEALWKALERM